MAVARGLLQWRTSWCLLESSHVGYVAEFHDFLWRIGPPWQFSDEILLETQIHQNSWNLLVETPKFTLVIHFSHLCKLYWRFIINVNYHQQTPPHLSFYLSSIKGWITQDITLEQDINIKLFLVIHALQDSKCLPWNFGRLKKWNSLKQITVFLSQVNWRNILRFLKTKHSLPSPFVVLLNHSICICGIFGSLPRH